MIRSWWPSSVVILERVLNLFSLYMYKPSKHLQLSQSHGLRNDAFPMAQHCCALALNSSRIQLNQIDLELFSCSGVELIYVKWTRSISCKPSEFSMLWWQLLFDPPSPLYVPQNSADTCTTHPSPLQQTTTWAPGIPTAKLQDVLQYHHRCWCRLGKSERKRDKDTYTLNVHSSISCIIWSVSFPLPNLLRMILSYILATSSRLSFFTARGSEGSVDSSPDTGLR